jgi:hypothetical protein
MREVLLVGKDQLFVMRWTCLSLVAIRPILESNRELHLHARRALLWIEARGNYDASGERRVPEIIETFDKALGCLNEVSSPLVEGADFKSTEDLEQVQMTLRPFESQISELDHIYIEDKNFQSIYYQIHTLQNFIDAITHGIVTCQLPGVKFDEFPVGTEPAHFSQLL